MVGMDGSWCPSCGYSVHPGTQFCGSCGQQLAAQGGAAPGQPPAVTTQSPAMGQQFLSAPPASGGPTPPPPSGGPTPPPPPPNSRSAWPPPPPPNGQQPPSDPNLSDTMERMLRPQGLFQRPQPKQYDWNSQWTPGAATASTGPTPITGAATPAAAGRTAAGRYGVVARPAASSRRTDHRAQPWPGAGRRSAAVGPDADTAAGRALPGAWRPVPAGHPVPDRRARRGRRPDPAARLPGRRTADHDRPVRTGPGTVRTWRPVRRRPARPGHLRGSARAAAERPGPAPAGPVRHGAYSTGSTGRPPTRRASTALPRSARASSRPASTASTSTARPRSPSRTRTASTGRAAARPGPTAAQAVPAGSTASPARTDRAASSAPTGHRWPTRSAR